MVVPKEKEKVGQKDNFSSELRFDYASYGGFKELGTSIKKQPVSNGKAQRIFNHCLFASKRGSERARQI
ncbi:hypothetical protein BATDEDRAFT_85736 [Batrachochytrium dendrobatidis JAM81]|uniref:Uncharacterized protein n=1 Tax=Batrachochytrium dendrobatidis (strain JAM81 / FGSC 10211) TaxID=684364 RepID=F4NSX1_BATDJ|nr:uncharacterized protein BATDEDRAFT_85736 [Batrachochytrium dendrobatidis JAM81]EGF83069.1 hypothetical protein BATDEDRAFT_85736 [Batrachochytrium dendrobatidis JAM81]|eukprot:XP_006675969.1 hypothetical protein BATDEDRAFT_85736 [Batrachochytrium dendrobatidis JAM81]